MSYYSSRNMYNTQQQQQQQPQFQQPSYNGYAQGPPSQHYPPPMTYAQAQQAQAASGLPPQFQQQQLVPRPQQQGENSSYYDTGSNLQPNAQSLRPYTPPQGQPGSYLNPQDEYRRRSSQASHHSHSSHHSHRSSKSGASKRSREPIPERATLGDTLLLMWETLKGAFDKRRV